MTFLRRLLIGLLLFALPVIAAEECFLLYDLSDDCEVLRRDRSELSCVRLVPCSTFKIANALIALDLEVVDEISELSWNGVRQPYAVWEQNHTLASAIRHSVVWYFQEVARRVGADNYHHYLALLDYGNCDISSGLDAFWLAGGSLAIAPLEQLQFLNRLYRDELPVSPATMRTVRNMLVRKWGENWTLSGKTGTGGGLSWFVGHLNARGREYTFVMLVRGEGVALKRTEEILTELGLLEGEV